MDSWISRLQLQVKNLSEPYSAMLLVFMGIVFSPVQEYKEVFQNLGVDNERDLRLLDVEDLMEEVRANN